MASHAGGSCLGAVVWVPLAPLAGLSLLIFLWQSLVPLHVLCVSQAPHGLSWMPALAALVPVPVTLHNVLLPVPGPFNVQPPLQACDPHRTCGNIRSAGLSCGAFAFCHPPFCHFCATVSARRKAKVAFEVVSFHECQTGSRRQVPSSLPELSPATPSMLTPTHTYRVWQALGPSSKSVLHPSPGQEGFPCLPLNQGTYLAFYPHPHICGLVFKPRHHETWTDWGSQIPLSTQEV